MSAATSIVSADATAAGLIAAGPSVAAPTSRGTGGTPTKGKRRVRSTARDRQGLFSDVCGLLDQPLLWDFAASVPAQVEGGPRKLPTIFYPTFAGLVNIVGSASEATATLGDRHGPMWGWLCEQICRFQAIYRPDDEPFDLADLKATTPVTAQNWYDARRTWLAPYFADLDAMFERGAATIARDVGYCAPTSDGVSRARRHATVVGDGKVTREVHARYRVLTEKEESAASGLSKHTHVIDRVTGAVVRAADMASDAHLYTVGDGRVVIGFKQHRWSVRDDRPSSTVFLSVRRDLQRDEAAVAIDALGDICGKLPGVTHAVHDGAIRGTHIRQAAAMGVTMVAPVAAKRQARNGAARVEKRGRTGVISHLDARGVECIHTLDYVGGRVFEVEHDSHGAEVLQPVDDPKIAFSKPRRDGKRRQYLTFKLNCRRDPLDRGEVVSIPDLRFALTSTEGELNVAENIRAIPPGSENYDRIYGWRQTTENDNNQSDASKYLRRARSARPDYSHIYEILLAATQNGRARQTYLGTAPFERTEDPPEALAA